MQPPAVDAAAWASPWREVQVGEKVTLSSGLVLTALCARPWPGCLLVALASVLAITVAARVRPGVLIAAMAAPLSFILLGALSVAVSVGGSPADGEWWRWGAAAVDPSSAQRALTLVGHGLAGSLAVMVLATTTPMVDLFTWARRWRVPDALLDVASLTYRLLWVLLATTVTVREAQAARLGSARPWRSAADAMGSVLVRSWSHARRLEEGLAGRGYESALLTLPVQRTPSWPFRMATVATLAAIWLLAWQVGR